MQSIFVSFYLVVLGMYILASIFVVYHLIKYSINSSLNILVLPLFIFVSAGLIFSNLTLFFSIDWTLLWSKLIDF